MGRNGAGKTTLIKVLTTLLTPTKGAAFVLGMDVVREASRVRRVINLVSGGEISGYGLLTVRENLWMFAQFYGIPSKIAHRRIDELLDLVGMADKAETKIRELSTGMRQKANLVRGLVTDPQVLFLDEPTIGLDVQTARDIRAFIRQWVSSSDGERSILLTTHHMAEAEQVCDRIGIIHEGKILAVGTPAALKAMVAAGSRWRLTLDAGSEGAAISKFPGVLDVRKTPADGATVICLAVEDDAALPALLTEMTAQGYRVLSLEKLDPTLEDAFIHLTGRPLHEDA